MTTKLVFSGQPDWGQWDRTWYEDQQPKRCSGQPVSKYLPAKCGNKDQHPAHDFVGTVVVHVQRNEVVEVDLDDGSAKAAAMRGFLERGICHKIGAP